MGSDVAFHMCGRTECSPVFGTAFSIMFRYSTVVFCLLRSAKKWSEMTSGVVSEEILLQKRSAAVFFSVFSGINEDCAN